MLQYRVKQNPKGGATLSAQLNNKGRWHKVRKLSNAQHAVLLAGMYKLLHEPDADARLTALLAQHTDVKLKVSNAECIKTLLEDEAKFIAALTLLNKPAAAAAAVAATPPAVEQKTRKTATKTRNECTYTVTGKDDNYHNTLRTSSAGYQYWVAFKSAAQLRPVYNSREELVDQLIIPAFKASNLRSGNPSATDLRNMVAHLVRKGCVTVA